MLKSHHLCQSTLISSKITSYGK